MSTLTIETIGKILNYILSGNIFVNAEINQQGQVIFDCKPGFADIKTFIGTTNLKEIADKIEKHGE